MQPPACAAFRRSFIKAMDLGKALSHTHTGAAILNNRSHESSAWAETVTALETSPTCVQCMKEVTHIHRLCTYALLKGKQACGTMRCFWQHTKPLWNTY
eukprot:1531762-Amphidinium_carterae.1